MPHSLHPHLHPSFVWLLSSRQCENTQETFTTMGLFTHLLLIRDLSVHRAGVGGGGHSGWAGGGGSLCFLDHIKTNTFTNQAPDVNFGWAQLASRLRV